MKKENTELSEFPIAFLTRANKLFMKHKTEVSADGTPRYIPNPNSDGTYALETCMEDYTPIYDIKELENILQEEIKQDSSVKVFALIDFEFTGLDNSFITNNEIIQVKIKNIHNQKCVIKNFDSEKPISAYTQLQHKVIRYEDCPRFDLEQLKIMLDEIELDINADFYGFGVEQDKIMLTKYGAYLSIKDIRTHFQKTEFAYRMATEGSGLETTYLIVTGEYPPYANHADFSEMFLIESLFEKIKQYESMQHFSIVPFGRFSGMDITEYVRDNRRAADGYRYNNTDDFSLSLSNAIEILESYNEDEDDYEW